MPGINEDVENLKEEGLGRRQPGEYRAKVVKSEKNTNKPDYFYLDFKCWPLDSNKEADSFDCKYIYFYTGAEKKLAGLRERTIHFLISFDSTKDGKVYLSDDYQSVVGKTGRIVLQLNETYFKDTDSIGQVLKPLQKGAFFNEDRKSAYEIKNNLATDRINRSLIDCQTLRKLTVKEREQLGLPPASETSNDSAYAQGTYGSPTSETQSGSTQYQQNHNAGNSDITEDMPF